MRIPNFEMERMQSTWENLVEYDMSESGVRPVTLRELAHPRVWWPWFRTAILSGYGAGLAGPNWRQLTGVFVVHRGHILGALRHRNSAARPDYVALVHGLRLGSVIR